MEDTLVFGVLCGLAIPTALTDWRHGTVPNALTYSVALLGVVGWAGFGWAEGGLDGAMTASARALLGMLCGAVPFAVLFALGAVGGGDTKLMGAVGALTADPYLVLLTALYGLVLAGLYAVALMVRLGLVRQTLRRILSAALSTAARVEPLASEDGPRVPLAATLSAGALLAAVQPLLGLPVG
jgi:prepilin peptidase CpaA